jgi:hypothetical protein
MTKIFYNGRRINGRFDNAKSFAKRILRFMGWSMLICFIVITGKMLSTDTVSAVTPETIDLTPQKIEALKADVVTRIMQCESGGHSEDDGIIIFDTNNEASIGQLQWQRKSVQFYEKKLYGRDVSPKEAVAIALDTTEAAQLARDVIFKADGLKNWLNCANRLGLRAEVDAINRISK